MPIKYITQTWSAGDAIFKESVAGNDAKIQLGVDTAGTDLKLFGATTVTYALWDESADSFMLYGDARIDLSNCTTKAANTDGGILKVGTSGSPVTEDTADMKFISIYLDNGATSGDNRGIYNRLYLTGAGGGGESFRTYTDVVDVAGGTAHGAHISLGFGTSGKLTGQGIAARCTLHMPATALPASNVTYSAIQAEIWSDGASSDPSGNKLSAIRILNDGNASGKADVDDDCAMIELMGWTSATGNMYCNNTLRIRIDTTSKYMVMSTIEDTLTTSISTSGSSAVNCWECTVTDACTTASGYAHAIHVTANNTGIKSGGCSVTQFNPIGVDLTLTEAGAAGFYALYAYIMKSGTPDCSSAAVAGVNVELTELGAIDYYTGLWVNKYNTTKATGPDAFCLFSNQGSGVTRTCFYVQGDKPDYLLQTANYTTDNMMVVGAGTYSTAQGYFKCYLGTTEVRIPFYTGVDA